MEVEVLLYAQKQIPKYQLVRRLGGSQSQSELREGEKNLLNLLGIKRALASP
jgi:hypothetical protein